MTIHEITRTKKPENTMPHDVSLLDRIASDFNSKPFVPHRFFRRGHAQTLGAFFWPGRFNAPDRTGDEERLFEVEPDSKVLARCRWQPNPIDHSTLVIWHGMEGSIASAYMLGTADKAFRAGFNVVRVNFRNCGGTEHLSTSLYHAGLTNDLRTVIDELIAVDGLKRIFVAGFSLGGNMVLKLAGECGDDVPRELKAVCAVSPVIELRESISLIKMPRNWFYHLSFLERLKQRIRTKHRHFPELYDLEPLRRVRTIEDFDNCYVAPNFGFADANDYYAKASSRPLINRIRVLTLIIHAEDDPFIPFGPLRDPSIAANPHVLLIGTARGGHVAFISENGGDERFWAEARVVDFCRSLDQP
jgi:predicted alpha/beta-fold hydrolase